MRQFYFTLIFTISFCGALSAQVLTKVQGPSPGKTVVYIFRLNGTGSMVNFTFLDSTVVIGRFSGVNYMRYECEPGHHVIWARSENRSFVEGILEPDRVYFLESVPTMGAVKAAVQLVPIDPRNFARLQKCEKLMLKKPPVELPQSAIAAIQAEADGLVERGIEAYNTAKANGKVRELTSAFALDPSLFNAAQQE